jgi:Nucleoside-diphosphate-sugar epimerases
MKILVTGAKGFVGKNLCWALKNIQAGKDKTHPGLTVDAVYEYDLDSTPEELDAWCKECDFVFNLAGVNRPKEQERVYGRELWVCFYSARYTEEVREYLSCNAE